MPTAPKPKPDIVTGKPIEKHLGRGAVMVVGNETIASVSPCRVNGIDHCIQLRLGGGDVDPGDYRYGSTPAGTLAGALDKHATAVDLTWPMMVRSERNAWEAAEKLLRQLADVCRDKATKASDESPQWKLRLPNGSWEPASPNP